MKHLVLWISLCLLAGGLSGCGAGGGQNRLAYVIFQDISSDTPTRAVYTLADPQAQPALIFQTPGMVSARFSPDGGKLAVLSMAEAPANTSGTAPKFDYTLQTMDADGRNLTVWGGQRSMIGLVPQFTFTADSRQVVFRLCQDERCTQADLYTGDLSSGEKMLKRSGDSLSLETLTPDGKALTTRYDPDARKLVYETVDLSSGAATEVTGLPDYTFIDNFTFTPQGQALARARDLAGGQSLLIAGSTDLTGWQTLIAAGEQVDVFLISPDGKKALIYSYTDACTGADNLSVVDLQSGASVEVGCSYTGSIVDFSPDSSEFIRLDEKVMIHRTSTTGEELESLPNGASWARYSPDGSQLVYWLRDRDKEQVCLALRPRTGGEATTLEKTCTSTADLSAIPVYLIWYASWRTPDNTW